MLKVNIGSGAVALDGWVNLDSSPGVTLSRIPGLLPFLGRIRLIPREQASARWPRNVRRHDVVKGLPFASASVDAVYSSHMLEHLPRDDAQRLLREVRRVLKPQGVLRLALPDLHLLAERYLSSDADDAGETFMREMRVGVTAAPRGMRRLVAAVGAKEHLWMYDRRSLAALVRSAGFATVSDRGFREGDCPDLERIETREESVFLEAGP